MVNATKFKKGYKIYEDTEYLYNTNNTKPTVAYIPLDQIYHRRAVHTCGYQYKCCNSNKLR